MFLLGFFSKSFSSIDSYFSLNPEDLFFKIIISCFTRSMAKFPSSCFSLSVQLSGSFVLNFLGTKLFIYKIVSKVLSIYKSEI